ncbi:uroporphyrinogen-III C-methyltransferase [Pseudobacteriovorax antillogorgiicola]|uniref:uroporphyrinogen-III C-methyltransferase n=1 Tax=Pseudobacteriovorax antillogorgiicola TaxID=1513793 RepID=A0A1Y6C157_9BACT|nr:uroporphyrinogen-III C-methyltransferase [Pseudobacteriovorax antillogorgiicola]TCS50681.1 uroporphyrinogen III methyltransferase/synthase [Pseudobacteriovorax antillogorgiicola]SMF40132.1 uroporphyrinogen III methyltransferase / synthase [Pseudobacteriovorax antillogorgiicola]
MSLVYLVGGGPGDPRLLTLRAKDLISKADLLAYDDLIHPQILSFAPPSAKLLAIGYRGLRQRHGSAPLLHPEVIEAAKAGKTVVRLKSGDPMIFGRAWDEAKLLEQHSIAVEVIPGVTAAAGAAASFGLPLTLRGISSGVTIETGHQGTQQRDLQENTRVVYMPRAGIKDYCQKLLASSRFCYDTPAIYVTAASTPLEEQYPTTLGQLASTIHNYRGGSPGIAIIGETVSYRLRSRQQAPQDRPLRSKRILVGRLRPGNSRLARKLRDLGADVIEAPHVKSAPLQDYDSFDKAIQNHHTNEVWFFASSECVVMFFQRLESLQQDIRNFKAEFAVAGEEASRELRKYGIQANSTSHGLCEDDLAKHKDTCFNKSIKILSSTNSKPLWLEHIRPWAAEIETIPCYERTFQATRLVSPPPHYLALPSSTVVKALCDFDYGFDITQVTAFAIGPKTYQAAKARGIKDVFMSEHDQIESLVDSIVKYQQTSMKTIEETYYE